MWKKWKNPNVRLVSVFILGILVGVGGFWLGTHRENPLKATNPLVLLGNQNTTTTPEAATSNLTENDAAGTVSQTPGLKVEDQNPGKTVVVAQASLLKPAWVVVRESIGGKPGNVLGARLFDKGRNSGIVPLLRATVVGQSYYAELYTYSGVKRPFDVKLDTPLKNADGGTVWVKFLVTKATD